MLYGSLPPKEKEKRNYWDHVIKILIMIKHALFDDDHHCDDSDALLKIF